MLSIVVTWRDRDELRLALPSLLSAARLVGGDVTVVDYGGEHGRLRQQVEVSGCDEARVVRVVGERYFNKSRAQNIGASASRHPVLFFCDCDIIVDPTLVAELACEVGGRSGIFATVAGVRESVQNARSAGNVVCFGYELWIRLANGRTLRILDQEEDAADGSRQAPGLLVVRRQDFLAVDGYNGRLCGWGWEDQDMIARLTLGAGLVRIERGTVTHISHGDAERMANYPPAQDRWESRDRMFRQAVALYDVNDFTGTYRSDYEQLRHELLAPAIVCPVKP